MLFKGHLHSSPRAMKLDKGRETINFTAKCKPSCEWWTKKWAERENGAKMCRSDAHSLARGTNPVPAVKRIQPLAWAHKHLNS